MYSRQEFIERFREVDSEELFDRLATLDLTEEAKDAIYAVLKERGVSDKDVEPLIVHAKKARYRSTTPTNDCDYCGKSILLPAVRDEGQKFCSEGCLRTARILEVAVDIPAQDIAKHAMEIKNGRCPSCGGQESKIEVRKYHWVWSAVYYTRWGTSAKPCCKKCGTKDNFGAILSSLVLGWWSIRGIFITPAQVISNLAEIAKRNDKSEPSEELIEQAKLQLAEILLKSKS